MYFHAFTYLIKDGYRWGAVETCSQSRYFDRLPYLRSKFGWLEYREVTFKRWTRLQRPFLLPAAMSALPRVGLLRIRLSQILPRLSFIWSVITDSSALTFTLEIDPCCRSDVHTCNVPVLIFRLLKDVSNNHLSYLSFITTFLNKW
jgi:hypothetical protein